jgi:hypothetical protein
MNVPGELTTPSSQFRHLETMQILLCDQLGASGFCAAFFMPPMRPRAMTSCLSHMKFQDFTFREFSLPLISNIPMLVSRNDPSQINGWIFLESDSHDHLLEQPYMPTS